MVQVMLKLWCKFQRIFREIRRWEFLFKEISCSRTVFDFNNMLNLMSFAIISSFLFSLVGPVYEHGCSYIWDDVINDVCEL